MVAKLALTTGSCRDLFVVAITLKTSTKMLILDKFFIAFTAPSRQAEGGGYNCLPAFIVMGPRPIGDG